jgi:hypothetical protein
MRRKVNKLSASLSPNSKAIWTATIARFAEGASVVKRFNNPGNAMILRRLYPRSQIATIANITA